MLTGSGRRQGQSLKEEGEGGRRESADEKGGRFILPLSSSGIIAWSDQDLSPSPLPLLPQSSWWGEGRVAHQMWKEKKKGKTALATGFKSFPSDSKLLLE